MKAREQAALPVALIPAYKPETVVLDTADALLRSGRVAGLVVVDDGSGREFESLFRKLASMGAVVLRHATNMGKGMALRTGFNHIVCEYPRSVGVVTLDADGQHLTADVLAVARRLMESPASLILGCRRFGAGVPLRSRVGNILTRHVSRLLAGLNVSDTQTGLRGIPLFFLPRLLLLDARGYDFELDMLIQARESRVPITEVPIETVYLEDNRSSHFHPLLDSMRIYMVFLRFNFSSLVTTAVDYAVFTLCFAAGLSLASAMALGRVCSWVVNYGVNRRFVFRAGRARTRSLVLYLALEIVMALISFLAIDHLFTRMSFNVYFAKILVESSLYLLTFTIQREIVFRPGRDRESREGGPFAEAADEASGDMPGLRQGKRNESDEMAPSDALAAEMVGRAAVASGRSRRPRRSSSGAWRLFSLRGEKE